MKAFHVPPLPRKFQNRTWLHVLLFVLTLATTTGVGALHYLSFVSELGRRDLPLEWSLLIQGLWYSLTVLAILGAHELGHYFACRYYNIDASLPYFLPLLIPLPIIQTGTLGAVIRIREPFTTRSVLFDIGVAGPIAGFLVLVPALFIGLAMSNIVAIPGAEGLVELGEPLLFRAAVKLMFGTIADGYAVNMHPIVFASWFGMLATALNLLPFGQLDGGHISYATARRFSTLISVATAASVVVMAWFSSSWRLIAAIMVVMLFLLGPRHPRVIYEHEPVSAWRYVIALCALIMLIICFTPVWIADFAPQ